MKLEVAYRTDPGKVRDINEDNLLIMRMGETYLMAVADGLGGYAAGEVASKVILVEIEDFFKTNPRQGIAPSTNLIGEAIAQANHEVYLLSHEFTEYTGMASTIVLAAIFEGKALIANIGDSRAYLLGANIQQITRDHSMAEKLVEDKFITKEEAFNHPQKHIVTKVVGSGKTIQPDFFEITLGEECLLLCSDGLTNSLKDNEIKGIVEDSLDLDTACDRLVSKANENGGKDNITVILARENQL